MLGDLSPPSLGLDLSRMDQLAFRRRVDPRQLEAYLWRTGNRIRVPLELLDPGQGGGQTPGSTPRARRSNSQGLRCINRLTPSMWNPGSKKPDGYSSAG